MPSPFTAAFGTKCRSCGKWINRGDSAIMDSGRAVHYPDCPGRYGLTADAARNEGARDRARDFTRSMEIEFTRGK